MLKLLFIIIGFFLFLGCNNPSEKKEPRELSDSLIKVVDSSLVEVVEHFEINEEFTYIFFEDYAKLNSKQMLYATFDSTYLRDDIAWYAEGTVKVEVTYLVNPKNNHVVKYCWSDDNKNKLDFIEANYFQFNDQYELSSSQVIESKTGLRLGMSLIELEKWNGNDFKFMGFSWDYEGTVLKEADDMLSEIPISVKLSLDYNLPTEPYNNLMGDIELSSSDSAVKKAPIVIDRFTFKL